MTKEQKKEQKRCEQSHVRSELAVTILGSIYNFKSSDTPEYKVTKGDVDSVLSQILSRRLQ